MSIDWYPLSIGNSLDAADRFREVLTLITELLAPRSANEATFEMSTEALGGLANILMMASSALETLSAELSGCKRKLSNQATPESGTGISTSV